MGIIWSRRRSNNAPTRVPLLVRFCRLSSLYRAFDGEKGTLAVVGTRDKGPARKGEKYDKYTGSAAAERKVWANVYNRLFIGRIIQTWFHRAPNGGQKERKGSNTRRASVVAVRWSRGLRRPECFSLGGQYLCVSKDNIADEFTQIAAECRA